MHRNNFFILSLKGLRKKERKRKKKKTLLDQWLPGWYKGT
jgi:hypothetical protein